MTAPAGPLVAGQAAPRSRAPRRWPWPVLSLALHASILASILLWHVRRPQEAQEAVGVALVFADSETEAPVEGQPGTAVALPPEAPPPVPDQPEQPRPEAVAELPPIPPTPEVERPPRPEAPRPPSQAPLPPRPERTGQRDPEPAPAPPQATPQPTPAAPEPPPPPTPPLPQNLPAAPATAELPPPPAPTPVAEQPPAPPQTPVEQPRRRHALPRVYEPDLEEPPTSERWATLPRVIEPDMVEPPPEPEPEPEPPPPPRPRQRAEPSRPAPPQRQASRSAPASPPAPSGPSTPGPDQPLVLGGGIATGAVVPPSLDASISNPPPTYPEASRRAGEQGIVGVVITIAPDGSVTAARVAQSSGYTSLDEAALMAVHRWRFRPGTRDGAPVVATIRTAVHFRLQGGGLR